MKKITAFLLMIVMLAGTVAGATTYENAAFIGTWAARGEDGAINARLYVDFCDSERIKCRFETIKNGEAERTYEIYQAAIDDTKAQSTFSTVYSANNWYPTGTCSIELTRDRIKFSIVTSNNITLYSGLFSPESTEFNANVSPYNTNVNVKINSQPVQTELSPFILKHRTYVPLRGIFEAMGINVEWFDTQENNIHTHEIRATRGDYTISIKRENKNQAGFGSWTLTKTVLGEAHIIDLSEVQPVIINNNTFVPLRVIVESFDTFIDWDDPTRTVLIVDENAAAIPEEGENIGAEVVPVEPETPTEEPTQELPAEGENTADIPAEEEQPEVIPEEEQPTIPDDPTEEVEGETEEPAEEPTQEETESEDLPQEEAETESGSVSEGTME